MAEPKERHHAYSSVHTSRVLQPRDAVERSRSKQVAQALQLLLTDGGKLLVNTGKPQKFLAWIDWVEQLTGVRLIAGKQVLSKCVGEEPMNPDAAAVARFKTNALWSWLALQPNLAESLEFLAQGMPELCENPATSAIEGARYRTTQTESGLTIAHEMHMQTIAGGDINVFLRDPLNGNFTALSKLERLHRPLQSVEVSQIYTELRNLYCFPQDGKVVVEWDVANRIQNGTIVRLQDRLRLTSKPLSVQLFNRYFEQAVFGEEQFLYNASPRIALVEALIENDGIRKIAILPGEMSQKGITLEQMETDATPALIQTLYRAAFMNVSPTDW